MNSKDIPFSLDATKYNLSDLRRVMAFLIGENGCPWDRVQTHQTIRKNLIEEAYEAVDAIDSGDPNRVKDELGDVLLQVFFHSAIAEKNAAFDIDSVADNLCRKLISRHSHLFGDDYADNPDDVLRLWDKNKMKEKAQVSFAETLADVPEGLPALMRSEKLQKRAAKAGFDWPDAKGALDKISEETEEIMRAFEESGSPLHSKIEYNDNPELFNAVEDEMGDLLFASVNYARLLGVDPEVALNRANNKFIKRFTEMENMAMDQLGGLRSLSLEEMDQLWEAAKEKERQ
jgi:tetrapyrrole methylase family protein/MazG family protein